MLYVEVYVPALEKEYEFSLNEHVKIGAVIDEISSVVSVQEQKKWQEDTEERILCNATGKCLLPKNRSLYECKVHPGSRLILM
jgi:hypothetical protein